MSKKLSGKVAIVTGSGRGIGRAIALKFVSEGAKVVINDLDQEPADEVVAEIRALGGEAVACCGNVTAADFGERCVKTALDTFGRLYIIINNAGFTWDNVIQKMSDEQWGAIIDCHLTAPFRILRAAQPILSELAKKDAAEGREVLRKVVNISSGAAGGNPGQANYSSAKAGILGMTKALAKEWGRYKVNVNAVAFGLIDTRLTQALAGDDSKTVNIEGREIKVGVQKARLDAASTTIPLGRPGKAEEAAGAVVLFCLPESNYCSGQTIYCGGGPGGNF